MRGRPVICAAAVLMPGRWVSRTVLQAEHCQQMCSSFFGALPQYGHVDVALMPRCVCVCVCAYVRSLLFTREIHMQRGSGRHIRAGMRVGTLCVCCQPLRLNQNLSAVTGLCLLSGRPPMSL